MRGRWTRITSKGGWDVCVCLSSWSCTVFIFLIVFSIFFFFSWAGSAIVGLLALRARWVGRGG